MNNLESPVTITDSTSPVIQIPSAIIKKKYADFGIAVDRFFIDTENIELRKCNKTGYRYYYPFSVFGDGKFYEELQNISGDYYPASKWEYTKALEFIKPNTTLLEVGCATGLFLDKCVAKNVEVAGLELNEIAAKEAQSKGHNVSVELLEPYSINNENKYDYVCSFQVLEHIWDVNSYFKNAIDCLKPGGKLIIGVPNNNPYIFKHDIYHTLNLPPHHAGLWNKESMVNAANYFNLTVEFIEASPLEEYKDWYQIQKNYYLKTNKVVGYLMSIIPRPIYKTAVKLFANKIEGKTLLAVLKNKA